MGKTNQNSFRETSKCASLEILHLCRIVLQFHFRATSEIHKNTRREKSISILTAYIYIYIYKYVHSSFEIRRQIFPWNDRGKFLAGRKKDEIEGKKEKPFHRGGKSRLFLFPRY